MSNRIVTLPAGAKHTHADVTYYGPCDIELPEEDAQWLAKAVVDARINKREQAKKISTTPEAKSADKTGTSASE